jgi:hypothetical protein
MPSSSNELVDIATTNGNGTSTGTTLGGNTVIVKGEGVAAGSRALVRDGEVIRSMPSLPATVVEV